MKEILINKLHAYLVHNNPDVLVALRGDTKVTSYLEEKVDALDDLPEQLLAEGKPAYIVEEICMDELTAEFRPSRYNYILSVLEDEFEAEYTGWQEEGTLESEVIKMLPAFDLVFDYFGFTGENEDDRKLRYATIGTMRQYLIGVIVDREYLDKIDFSVL